MKTILSPVKTALSANSTRMLDELELDKVKWYSQNQPVSDLTIARTTMISSGPQLIAQL